VNLLFYKIIRSVPCNSGKDGNISGICEKNINATANATAKDNAWGECGRLQPFKCPDKLPYTPSVEFCQSAYTTYCAEGYPDDCKRDCDISRFLDNQGNMRCNDENMCYLFDDGSS
jgi:hypothetical protein